MSLYKNYKLEKSTICVFFNGHYRAPEKSKSSFCIPKPKIYNKIERRVELLSETMQNKFLIMWNFYVEIRGSFRYEVVYRL